MYSIGAKKADILTTDSAFSKKSIQKYLGICEDRIHLVPVAVNDRYFESYDKTAVTNIFVSKYGFDKFILYVSRIEPRKNHALLLQVYLDLQLYLRGYYLVLLGHESIKTLAFDKIIKELPENIRSFIFCKSDIPDEELILFYRAASVFVYPSKAEGFGIPPLEAAAGKTPVLCSNTSAMEDFDFFGENHFDPSDAELFKNRLSVVLATNPDSKSLEQLAQKIHHKYSWKESADTLYELIVNDHLNNTK